MTTTVKNLPVSIGIFWDSSDCDAISLWMQKRDDPEETRFNGLWEFPGGKVELEESITEAVIREIQEEVGLNIAGEKRLKLFGYYRIERDEFNILLHVFLIHGDQNTLPGGRWVRFQEGEDSSKLKGKTLSPNEQIINDVLHWIRGLRRVGGESMAWD